MTRLIVEELSKTIEGMCHILESSEESYPSSRKSKGQDDAMDYDWLRDTSTTSHRGKLPGLDLKGVTFIQHCTFLERDDLPSPQMCGTVWNMPFVVLLGGHRDARTITPRHIVDQHGGLLCSSINCSTGIETEISFKQLLYGFGERADRPEKECLRLEVRPIALW